MKLEFIALDKLSVSKANMRYGRKVPDVSDILPTVRARGILQPLIVRPNCAPDGFEIVAGARRFHAASIVAGETGQDDPLPCAILDDGDDAAAVEASLIENLARLDPDEVTQWENFVRLVKEGRKPADIAATFGLADTAVRRVLALGNLLPRIRRLYRDEAIDAATVRHLTMASKAQQKSWLALFDDPDGYVPTGYQLKSWLFGGAAISTKVALFDLEGFGGQIVGDLFGEERYFADPDQFWTAQYAAIEARRADYLEAGWGDVAIVPPGDTFHRWEYERAAKRKGGRIYIDVTQRGEVVFHEGYVTRTEARRAANDGQAGSDIKPTRPEVTGPMQTYIDLHRHAAVRAALTGHPHVALRMMVAHAITGSPLWTVRVEPQSSRNQAVAESVEVCAAEAAFDEKRRAVLGVLGFDADTPTVAGGNGDPTRWHGCSTDCWNCPIRSCSRSSPSSWARRSWRAVPPSKRLGSRSASTWPNGGKPTTPFSPSCATARYSVGWSPMSRARRSPPPMPGRRSRRCAPSSPITLAAPTVACR